MFLTAGGRGRAWSALPTVKGVHPLTAPLVLVVSFYIFIEALARRRAWTRPRTCAK